jgi:hypothetical protein
MPAPLSSRIGQKGDDPGLDQGIQHGYHFIAFQQLKLSRQGAGDLHPLAFAT